LKFSLSAILCGAFLLLVALAQFILPTSTINLTHAFAPPSFAEPFGTTPLGQSVLAQVVGGAGQTLAIAIFALVISLLVSLLFAASSYLWPKFIADIYLKIIDAWLAIPGIFVALSIGYFLPQSMLSVTTALVLSEFAPLQKFLLQRLGDVRHADFIIAAEVMGAPHVHTARTHILPQLIRESGYLFFLNLPTITLSLASLEFLGVQTGNERLSLGMQIAIYKDYILLYPLLSIAPAAMLMATLGALYGVAAVWRNR